MTIILQYQFWDLKVNEDGFEVGLHFKNIPERLHVPFDAVAGFYDPSVQFGLKFEAQGEDGGKISSDDDEETLEVGPVANPPRPTSLTDKPKLRGAGSEPGHSARTQLAPGQKAGHAEAATREAACRRARSRDKGTERANQRIETKVVSIDAFRKKT